MHAIVRLTRCVSLIAVAACLLAGSEVHGQQQQQQQQQQSTSLFGNRGPLSQTQSGLGGSIGSQLGMGGAGASASGVAQGGISLNTELGQLSGTIGQGFIGRSDAAGRFVGNRLAGQQTTGQTGRSQGFNQLGSAFGRGNGAGFGQGGQFNQFNQFNQSGTTRRTIRPAQRIAFTYPARTPDAVVTQLESQWTKLAERGVLPGQIEMQLDEEGQVILRGRVESDHARQLAEMMVRMEPGVRTIRNELTVTPPPPAPSP